MFIRNDVVYFMRQKFKLLTDETILTTTGSTFRLPVAVIQSGCRPSFLNLLEGVNFQHTDEVIDPLKFVEFSLIVGRQTILAVGR